MPRGGGKLSPSRGCSFCRYGGLHFFSIGLLAGFADIDAALEKCAILNGNAGRYYVAGEGTVAADIHSIARREIAANLAEHDNFPRIDVGRHNSVATHGHTVASKVDGSFH